jgi:hypothetical protein
MHLHIPRPRRKATCTCTDTAGVVRTVHGELMWPFAARVNEKTAPIEQIAVAAICRRPRDARRQIYAPTANARLAGIAADDGTDCHSTWVPRWMSRIHCNNLTVHISEGSLAEVAASHDEVRFESGAGHRLTNLWVHALARTFTGAYSGRSAVWPSRVHKSRPCDGPRPAARWFLRRTSQAFGAVVPITSLFVLGHCLSDPRQDFAGDLSNNRRGRLDDYFPQRLHRQLFPKVAVKILV